MIIGSSRGGLLAMVMAATEPARVAGVVLNDVGPALDPRGVAKIGDYLGKPPVAKSIDEAAAGSLVVKVKRVLDENGASFPAEVTLSRAEVESWHGERFLHLQVNGPRDALDRKYMRVEFDVTLK